MESGPTADVPPRAATSAIEHALRASPVVVVLGARQTGKTTLVRSLPQLAQRPYLTLDDFDLRAQAAEDPQAVVDRDRKRRPGRFVLTRIRESVDDGTDRRDPGRPRHLRHSLAVYQARAPGTGTHRRLERARVREVREVVSQPQVHRFMNLMETSFQAIRLAAYSVNRTKRLIKAPKLYWCDTALALHLAGETEPRGAHLENLVLTDLLTWRDTQPRRPEVLYWRTATGDEVDFVIETPANHPDRSEGGNTRINR
jgi:predicted AAA+ superfamily ATPase